MDAFASLIALKAKRQASADKYGSPLFDIYPASIAADTLQWFWLATEKPASEKFLPLDFLEVTNNDAVDLELHFPSGQKLYIASGVIKVLEDENYSSFGIKNLSSTTATTQGKIHVVCQRLPMSQDRLVRRSLAYA